MIANRFGRFIKSTILSIFEVIKHPVTLIRELIRILNRTEVERLGYEVI